MAHFQTEQTKFALKFLGVNGGSSESHTNAFFFPDPETLVFLDLSLLNFAKARQILESRRGVLKRVIALVTHLHPDHASGIVMLGYNVRHVLENVTLEVITDVSFGIDAMVHFDTEGGKAIYDEERDRFDEIYRLYALRNCFGTRHRIFVGQFGELQETIDDVFSLPTWFFRVIPTDHAPRLSGATGFEFELDGKRIVYSGDTRESEPFFKAVREAYDEDPEMPIELYLEVSSTKWPVHLYLPDIKQSLIELLLDVPTAKVILMHYDNRYAIAKEVLIANRIMDAIDNPRIFLAEDNLF